MNIRKENSLQTLKETFQKKESLFVDNDQFNAGLGGNFLFDLDKKALE